MPSRITNDILESYLRCKTKAHLKLSGRPEKVSDYENMLAALRSEVRLQALYTILRKHADVLRNVVLTTEILSQESSYILDGTFEDDQFHLCLDGLKKQKGHSKLGDFHYLPVLFSEEEKVRKEQRLLLDLYGLLLAKVQGTRPETGIVWHGRQAKASRIRLNSDVRKTEKLLRNLKEFAGETEAPTLMLNDHCQVCCFQNQCHQEALQQDNLSLLRNMGEKEISKWNRRGIFTVTQLSCTFRPRKKTQKLRKNHYMHQSALKALAIREKKVFVYGPVDLPQSYVQMFLDLEGDLEARFVYLIGLLVIKDGCEKRYSFWANEPSDEEKIITQFLDVVKEHADFSLFCYGSYELKFLRRAQNSFPDQPIIEKLLANSCNVLSLIYSHVYFPTYSNSLKDVGRHLGCQWSENVESGITSVVWRNRWERSQNTADQQRLIQYNLEDCLALRTVTAVLYDVAQFDSKEEDGGASSDKPEVSKVEDMEPQSNRREWCSATFAIPDLKFINERAYFDYQREKVYIRTQKNTKQTNKKKRTHKKTVKPTEDIEISADSCPVCHGTKLTRTQDKRLARLAYDLVIRENGIRRRVIRHWTSWHHCGLCGERFLPQKYRGLAETFHGLNSWVIYQLVRHRVSYKGIGEMLKDFFGLQMFPAGFWEIKSHAAQQYQETLELLWNQLMSGSVLHVDETEVKLRDSRKGYVWVFTNLEEVVFMFRESREGSFLQELLQGFQGVLVTDFYSAYDSLDCAQQKCLIHLIRDMNEDLKRSPWDEEFKSVVGEFGKLLRTIVSTIDERGLKRRHLNKHRTDVDRFYRWLSRKSCQSELAEHYQQRLTKYRDKLFTFLERDGIPWNNNNAEHAIKQFAKYRRDVDGQYTQRSLPEYLLLLSLRLTCKYKGVSFLKFLLSQQQDIDQFRKQQRKKPPLPHCEQIPDGCASYRRDRPIKGESRQKRKNIIAEATNEAQRQQDPN